MISNSTMAMKRIMTFRLRWLLCSARKKAICEKMNFMDTSIKADITLGRERQYAIFAVENHGRTLPVICDSRILRVFRRHAGHFAIPFHWSCDAVPPYERSGHS
ncbi:hypothetical protein KL86DPRO_11483 [uncultured delta proteobacterium]|uniref:Uncharacterized protein n=1 Tax=uncultured delta proteobacterium TaxID=34034 RepID=A0A212JHT2_9DELT|nr:hypothetical protein KL86DPRO_11483 [uncultured delta proteobacterium]